jgi:ParB family chromosome partitioning protein
MNLEIKYLSLSDIKPYWRNPRDNEKAVAAVMESVKQFGVCQPIVIDTENIIVAGHTRYKAFSRLGMDSVPTVCPLLSAKQARAYRIFDNKTAELSSWNNNLAVELRELGAELQDLQGFFPDLNKELSATTGGAYEPVTQAQVNEATQVAETRFDNAGHEALSEQLQITCPHCTELFFINRNDVLRRP